MSVLIKNMKMPPDCADCPFDWRECEWLRGNSVFSFGKRPDDCPLIEVTTPHGDLVDRNKLLEKAHYDYNEATHNYNKFRVVFENDIIDAPVVIEGDMK